MRGLSVLPRPAAGPLGAALLALLVLLPWTPVPLSAQQGDCSFVEGSGQLTQQTFGQTQIVQVQTPRLVCADGGRIRADSARAYTQSNFYQFFGDVVYVDGERELRADFVRMWRTDGRIEAQGAVRIDRRTDGAELTGQELEYLEAGPYRPEDLLTVRGGQGSQATATICPEEEPTPGVGAGAAPPSGDSVAAVDPGAVTPGAAPAAASGACPSPWDIDADQIRILGEGHLIATGEVRLRRDELDASARGLEYDQANDLLVLRGDGVVRTQDYELRGDSIRGVLLEQQIEELLARGRAVLEGEELELASPVLHLYLEDQALERLVAMRDAAAGAPAGDVSAALDTPDVGEGAAAGAPDGDVLAMEHPPRPVARAQGLTVVADSLDVVAPAEVLERLVAVGRARAESTARDSLNTAGTPEIARRDWIGGDTLVATFRPVEGGAPTPGGAGERPEYEVERLVATSNAVSLYRMAPADTAAADTAGVEVAEPAAAPVPDAAAADTSSIEPPSGPDRSLAIHYVRGHRITLVLEDGEVAMLNVEGQTQGLHLEPVAPSRAAGATGGTDPGRGGGR